MKPVVKQSIEDIVPAIVNDPEALVEVSLAKSPKGKYIPSSWCPIEIVSILTLPLYCHL